MINFLKKIASLAVVIGVMLLLKMQYTTGASVEEIIEAEMVNRSSIKALIKDDLQEIVDTIEKETQERQQHNLYIDSIRVENKRQESVGFNSNNVLYPSNASAEEIFVTLSAFSGGNLAEYAWTFKEIEDAYNLNAFFLASLVAYESGWGKSNRATTQNNLTGYAVFNSNAAGVTFDSAEESIYRTADLLMNNYLKEDGRNYNGVSVEAINTDYCLTEDGSRTDYKWSTNLISIANDFVEYYHSDIKELQEIPEK